ncbi:MAG: response regulator [Actinobacteria bacterium]|nr:response regulator [Actinomycetota bacterium]
MSAAGPRVLVVEDEPQMMRFLRTTLVSQGFSVVEADTGQGGVEEAAFRSPDVILLDLMLPDIDGLEVIRRVREWSRIPIVVISARGREEDKIAALDLGADDYVTKPFGVGELFARIRVSLRHAAGASSDEQAVFVLDDLKVDMVHRRVFVGETEVHLTNREYKMLVTLIRYAGKVVTHRQLLQEVWGPQYETEIPYLRVYIGQLRRKLEADPARPRFLLTESGVGYRLKVD